MPKKGRPDGKVTTGEIARAAGVSLTTIHRWAKEGVLPEYHVHNAGARGRVAMWPMEAPEQAIWVLAQLTALRSWDEIRTALAAGEFKPRKR